jgi:Uma2 family endonuclease
LLAVTAERSYVPSMTAAGLVTAEELLHMNIPDKHVELVRGVLVVREPPGGRHGRVAMNVAVELSTHVRAHQLGVVYAAETGFTLSRRPDTVRAPDVAFISRDRLPSPEPIGYPELGPDLVVEVLSPGDRPGEVHAKIADWLSAGTRLVWVIDPGRRIARVYRQDGSESIVMADQALDGEDVVPGFSCRLDAIL